MADREDREDKRVSQASSIRGSAQAEACGSLDSERGSDLLDRNLVQLRPKLTLPDDPAPLQRARWKQPPETPAQKGLRFMKRHMLRIGDHRDRRMSPLDHKVASNLVRWR